MDFTLIPAALSSIRAAKEIGSSALALRDWNLVAAEIGKLNEQLITAQESLFSHNAQLLELQQQVFTLTERARKAEDALAERGQYKLVEIGKRTWAYEHTPSSRKTEDVGVAHYVCQSCFDNGRKVVLQYFDSTVGETMDCPVCKVSIYVGPEFLKNEQARSDT